MQQASEREGVRTLLELQGEAEAAKLTSPLVLEEWDCTYYPWEFGALCGVVVKAATQASGDCVRLLESKTHGIHRLAPAAHHPLQRDEEEEETHSDGADPSDPSVSGQEKPRGCP